MKPKLFLTRLIPQPGIDLLEEVFELNCNTEDRALTKKELLAGVKDADALLCLLTDSIDADVIDAGPSLKVISNYAVGYNNIDVAYATGRGIKVCNTPGVLTETTADLTWALILAAARRIPESDTFTRAGNFRGWEPMLMLGQDVFGKTLGILGMGRIGQAVSRRAVGFGMKISYYSPETDPSALHFEAQKVDFDTLLQSSDVLSLHAPLTPETRHIIGKAELQKMKSSAILINTARGPLVDEIALIDALREGQIFAAGLDVYEQEPDFPMAMLELKNLVLLPHIGSASIETRTKMAILAAQNAIAVIRGEQPPALVNPA
ncbi:MAG TPA: D-glycerate dehydrogenase [Candidatus Cloacimonadota bacterium]|nr:D-glycerate dehydrogenase [Candidatus Cloacimonadota bacterium]